MEVTSITEFTVRVGLHWTIAIVLNSALLADVANKIFSILYW